MGEGGFVGVTDRELDCENLPLVDWIFIVKSRRNQAKPEWNIHANGGGGSMSAEVQRQMWRCAK